MNKAEDQIHKIIKIQLAVTPLSVRYLTVTLVAQHLDIEYLTAAQYLANLGLIPSVATVASFAYRRKDIAKSKYLLKEKLPKVLAVYGLATKIPELVSYLEEHGETDASLSPVGDSKKP